MFAMSTVSQPLSTNVSLIQLYSATTSSTLSRPHPVFAPCASHTHSNCSIHSHLCLPNATVPQWPHPTSSHHRSFSTTMHPPCLRLPAFLSLDDPSSLNFIFFNRPIDRHCDFESRSAIQPFALLSAYVCRSSSRQCSVAHTPAIPCSPSTPCH